MHWVWAEVAATTRLRPFRLATYSVAWERDDRAAALLATLDGLVIIHVTAGSELARAAARGLGLDA